MLPHCVRDGVEFAILKPEQITREMNSKLLAAEKYLLVCTPLWKDRKLKDILQSERIIDFDETDQMSINYLKQFNLLKHAKPYRLFVNRTESLCSMLMEGYGYGVLTKELSAPYLQRGNLIALNSGKTLANLLALAWYARPEPPSYFLSIINSIK